MMRYAVTQFEPSQLMTITTGAGGTVQTAAVLCILGFGCILLFVVGILQERGIQIREQIAKWPPAFHFANLSWFIAGDWIFRIYSIRARIYLCTILGKEEQTIWRERREKKEAKVFAV